MAHILLLEPNQALARIYCEALERAGHQVVTRGSAQAAVHAADDTPPDAVIIELQLPGHSGVEFLYEFRSYSDWHRVPAIVHTLVPPHSLTLSRIMLDRLNIAAYLYKPAANLRTLTYTVNTALSRQA